MLTETEQPADGLKMALKLIVVYGEERQEVIKVCNLMYHGKLKGVRKMEQTERERIIEVLNKVLNPLDKLRSDLINEGRAQSKAEKKKDTKKLAEEISKPLADMGELNRELTVKQSLERYGQPTDDDHIASVLKIVDNNGITLEELESCLERVKYANDKDPKNDLKKYTYSCLYKLVKS